MSNTSLLGNTSRIETPYIKIVIGEYTFGVYQKETAAKKDSKGFYSSVNITYPNYVKSLNIVKINGQVNQYNLSISYPVQPGDDPNFFEKVFSSVSKSRKILFSYGDMSAPTYVYKNEQAVITNIQTTFNIKGSVISYQVSAVSSAALAMSACYTFQGGLMKPSNQIKHILYDRKDCGLLDLFYGMNNRTVVDMLGLLPGNDAEVLVSTKTNISALDYIKYLISCMRPAASNNDNNIQNTFYILSICDEVAGETSNSITTETLGGPYFKISAVNKSQTNPDAYEIDIGYPTQNIVTEFQIVDNENYSIYYDWQSKINTSNYVDRIDENGEIVKQYAPITSSSNELYTTRPEDKTWLTKVTQYPISATITLKGLLRAATLMEYVRLNVLFCGERHISSGLYIVTKQTDQVDESGYRTTLNLTRVDAMEV